MLFYPLSCQVELNEFSSLCLWISLLSLYTSIVAAVIWWKIKQKLPQNTQPQTLFPVVKGTLPSYTCQVWFAVTGVGCWSFSLQNAAYWSSFSLYMWQDACDYAPLHSKPSDLQPLSLLLFKEMPLRPAQPATFQLPLIFWHLHNISS